MVREGRASQEFERCGGTVTDKYLQENWNSVQYWKKRVSSAKMGVHKLFDIYTRLFVFHCSWLMS